MGILPNRNWRSLNCTISVDAVCILTGISPIYLVVKKIARLLERMTENKNTAYRTRESAANENKVKMRKEERLRTIREWDGASYGGWTGCFIPELARIT